MLKRRVFLGGMAALASATALRAGTSGVVELQGPAFGARWHVRLAAGADTDRVVAVVATVVQEITQAMSPYLATSEMSRFNTVQTRDWVPLSPNFHATLTEAKRVAELTQGAFDPTLGGIVGRYGFGPITAAPAGAFADLSLTATAARKAHRAQTVDLCGIAKGYALDLIVSRLAALGLRDIFVELGGEVMTLGQHPEGRPWRAGVERPLPGATTVQCAVSVAGEALATSGDRVNSFVHAGRRYGHIIDPLSHRPAAGDLASVSVFAPRAMTADALATALFAMGAELGVAFAEAQGIPALFLTRDGPDLRETATGGFAARIIG